MWGFLFLLLSLIFLLAVYLLINHAKSDRVFHQKARHFVNKLLLDKEQNRFAYIDYNTFQNEIVINIEGKVYKLASFNYDSNPEKLFRYIYEHPNQHISLDELVNKAKIDQSSISDITTLLTKIGFKGNIRNLFIRASKQSIYFKNPITFEEFWQTGIDKSELLAELSELAELQK